MDQGMGQGMRQGWEFHPTFPPSLVCGMKGWVVRQRFSPKHFILKAISRKCPNPGNPTLFEA
jgi:hypothetical protein